jgi:hypothetical protein
LDDGHRARQRESCWLNRLRAISAPSTFRGNQPTRFEAKSGNVEQVRSTPPLPLPLSRFARRSAVDPNAPVVNDRYRATNQVRGVLPENLLVGEGGGQIAVGVGLGE